jgi:FkbM family methyltransferase
MWTAATPPRPPPDPFDLEDPDMALNDLTVVADVGARYGIHPSWNGFDAPMRYIAFEPDTEEADRLREVYADNKAFAYEVLETALDKEKGKRDFHLLKHRGLSSCLKPDLTSECFRHLKPGQAEIERILQIDMERGDDVFDGIGVIADFLKIDTEGTEQDVLEGFERHLDKGVLGVRLSCNFQPCFIGQRLFSDSHDYLVKRDFILLNLDYSGYGYPRLGLFRKPDPIEPENHRYGILVAADAVWIAKPALIDRVYSGEAATIAKLKLSAFCFLNNAPDYAVDLLREVAEAGLLTDAVKATRVFKSLRLKTARFLGRYRTVPDEQWERARGILASIFGEPLGGGSDYYPQLNAWVRDFAKSA